MEVILDTNFIISCLEKRIDFLEELQGNGFKVVVPRGVIEEIKDLKKNSKLSMRKRQIVGIALDLVEDKRVKKVSFGAGNIDENLIRKGLQGVYIATLDNGIKRRVPNKIIINDAKNRTEVVRDGLS
jgi:rRNA-processing protein FCF1